MGYREKGEILTENLRESNEKKRDGSHFAATVENDGRIVLTPEVVRHLGLDAGAKVDIVAETSRAILHPNIHSLARIYIEPTSVCNLTCQTCIRNTWAESPGYMEMGTFDQLAEQLKKFPHLQSVMFGGFGEPLAHKSIMSMIRSVKSLGIRAEMVTNGTLLDEAAVRGIFENRLDTLWISLDGATGATFEDIRKGASFPQVMDGLELLQAQEGKSSHKIDLGIAYVAMRKNIDNLKHLDRLIRKMGVKRVSVSNVIPYTEAMETQMICVQALTLDTFTHVAGRTDISLPRLDAVHATMDPLMSLLRGHNNLSIMGSKVGTEGKECRFIKDRSTFVRWDGKVSPCMGLLHSHVTYLYGLRRTIESYNLGDINSEHLFDIWNSTIYREFREKVRAFDFSPCHCCGGCDYLETNKEDCFGNTHPVCGGCLWAAGVIQCP